MKKMISFGHIPLYAAVCVLAMTFFFSGRDSRADETAAQAYELRMRGKTDEAKALLERTVAENPKNAAAYYELARTQLYMATGDPGKMGDYLKEAQQSIEQAIRNDPKNVIYPYFMGHVAFFQTYISMSKDQEEAKKNAERLCGAFETALALKPDYPQAMLYLVEIYRIIPENMGGNRDKAEQCARKLEKVDEVYGAKARSFLLLVQDSENKVDESKRAEKLIGFWKDVLAAHPKDAEALAEMGRACLGADKAAEAASCFDEATRIEPEKRILFLDMGRSRSMYYSMMKEKNPEAAQQALSMAESYLGKYLDAEPRIPLKAFALGILGRAKMQRNDQAKSRELLEQAQKLDPYYSKAWGVPDPDLFIPPGEISHSHRYLFLPY